MSAAVRQAIQTRRILEKLLQRIQVRQSSSAMTYGAGSTESCKQMTRDEDVQRQLLRLKGFNLMHHILKEYPTDLPIIILVRSLLRYPNAVRLIIWA